MKCLANWPLSGENSHFPNYRGFEMDVFSVVKDYFVGLRVPLCTYDLFDIFVSAFIKVKIRFQLNPNGFPPHLCSCLKMVGKRCHQTRWRY